MNDKKLMFVSNGLRKRLQSGEIELPYFTPKTEVSTSKDRAKSDTIEEFKNRQFVLLEEEFKDRQFVLLEKEYLYNLLQIVDE